MSTDHLDVFLPTKFCFYPVAMYRAKHKSRRFYYLGSQLLFQLIQLQCEICQWSLLVF